LIFGGDPRKYWSREVIQGKEGRYKQALGKFNGQVKWAMGTLEDQEKPPQEFSLWDKEAGCFSINSCPSLMEVCFKGDSPVLPA
jgi:hypothetical protein